MRGGVAQFPHSYARSPLGFVVRPSLVGLTAAASVAFGGLVLEETLVQLPHGPHGCSSSLLLCACGCVLLVLPSEQDQARNVSAAQRRCHMWLSRSTPIDCACLVIKLQPRGSSTIFRFRESNRAERRLSTYKPQSFINEAAAAAEFYTIRLA